MAIEFVFTNQYKYMKNLDKELKNLDNFLSKIMMLEECTKLERKAVEESLKYVFLEKDKILFNQNEFGNSIYIVKKGLIGAYTTDSDGRKREVARFSTGQSFGEMAIIESMPRSTTCYAIQDSELLILESHDFYQFIWNFPMIGIKILKSKLRNMVSWISDANNFLTHMVMWGEKARYRAITDRLTDLYNRRFFEESMKINISKSMHKNIKFCILMCDLDNFHNINNQFGVNTGDEILKFVAKIFKSNFKKNSVISRLGGDEFAVLLPDSIFKTALQKANNFKSALENTKITILNNRIIKKNITVSISVVECPVHGKTMEELMDTADKILYKVKNSGKNMVMGARI